MIYLLIAFCSYFTFGDALQLFIARQTSKVGYPKAQEVLGNVDKV